MTLITPPLRSGFAIRAYGRGGVAIINVGVAVGLVVQLGVPVVQIKGNLMKSGNSGPIIVTPLLLRFGPK